MGNLLRLLAREEGTCFSPQRYDLFLDFESECALLVFCFLFFFTNCDVSCFIADAQPTESEKEMFLEVDSVLKKGQIILNEISQYRGASKEIREVNLISFLFCCTCKIPKFIPEKNFC